jgi:hypothetical protein
MKSRWGAPESFEDALRQIVLLSGDVVPEQVTARLQAAQGHRANWDDRARLFDAHQAIATHLPHEYVDFATAFLLQTFEEEEDDDDEEDADDDSDAPAQDAEAEEDDEVRDGPSSKAIREMKQWKREVKRMTKQFGWDKPDDSQLWQHFGIGHDHAFVPPAHVKGPFLFLLQHHESEGLRLIHAIANAAVDCWRGLVQRDNILHPARTPLPAKVLVGQDKQIFWGDEGVYRWFRINSVSSFTVMVALMALEAWMEEQVEAGRDPDELFKSVLSGSRCVALPAVCLSVALAHPQKCARAALPLVGCAHFWRMDCLRFAHDHAHTNLYVDTLSNGLDALNSVRQERESRPRRALDIRNLADFYVLASDDDIRADFQARVARFSSDLPFFWEEEARDEAMRARLTRDVEGYQSRANRDNYVLQPLGDDRFLVTVKMPDAIEEERRQAAEQVATTESYLALYFWAQRAAKDPDADLAPEFSFTLQDAVAMAQSFEAAGEVQDVDLFPSDLGKVGNPDVFRIQAIVGAAVVALSTDAAWAQEHGQLAWCRDIVLKATLWPGLSFLLSVWLSPARGLGALIAHDPSDMEARTRLVQLAATEDNKRAESVIVALSPLWHAEPTFAWNTLNILLSMAVRPRPRWPDEEGAQEHEEAVNTILSSHVPWLDQDEMAPLPSLRPEPNPSEPPRKKSTFNERLIFAILSPLPLGDIASDAAGKARLLRLTDDLTACTMERNRPRPGERLDRAGLVYWNYFYARWLARLSGSLTQSEWRQHALGPLREAWPDSPQVMADALDGLISTIHFYEEPAPEAVARWKELAAVVLDGLEGVPDRELEWQVDTDRSEVASLLVFVRSGACRLKADWPHAALFRDVIERYAQTLGRTTRGYSALLLLLEGPGWCFVPEAALDWAWKCLENQDDPRAFLSNQSLGQRTAMWLARVWSEHSQTVLALPAARANYTALVEALVQAGVPLVGQLQSQLEEVGG